MYYLGQASLQYALMDYQRKYQYNISREDKGLTQSDEDVSLYEALFFPGL